MSETDAQHPEFPEHMRLAQSVAQKLSELLARLNVAQDGAWRDLGYVELISVVNQCEQLFEALARADDAVRYQVATWFLTQASLFRDR